MYYSNALLKEDVYVFEGQQLETLYDIENMLLQIIYILKISKKICEPKSVVDLKKDENTPDYG